MSKYRVHDSEIKEESAILDALADRIVQFRGISKKEALELVKANVYCHKEPQRLAGYDMHDRKYANIVVPTRFGVEKMGASQYGENGFLKTDKGYQAIVDDMDRRWNPERFWQIAATSEAVKIAEMEGYLLETQENKDGIIEVNLVSQT
jgi:hypothetical protein